MYVSARYNPISCPYPVVDVRMYELQSKKVSQTFDLMTRSEMLAAIKGTAHNKSTDLDNSVFTFKTYKLVLLDLYGQVFDFYIIIPHSPLNWFKRYYLINFRYSSLFNSTFNLIMCNLVSISVYIISLLQIYNNNERRFVHITDKRR